MPMWSCLRFIGSVSMTYLAQAGNLSDKILLTCSLPMNKSDSRLMIGNAMSGAETLARKARRAHVVSAFSTVPARCCFPCSSSRKNPPYLVFCGDDKGAKKRAASLIRDAGLHPVDAGPFSAACYVEPF